MTKKICKLFLASVCFVLPIVLPSQASADWIAGEFTATPLGTAVDLTCAGGSRSTFAGPGFGSINFDDPHNPFATGTHYLANINYSFCDGTGSVVSEGLFEVRGGTQGSL